MRGNVVGHVRLVLALGLAGCSTGNRGSIRYDTSVRNERGTIALSDPKLYSRENLINERARDVAWIDGLIVASEDPTKLVFKPALLREMEEISAFSAALGLKFDPAAATSYRRANETAGVQQEIDVLKIQLQLEQLRRDAELLRAKLPLQTELVNSGLGALAPAGAATAPGAVTPGDVTQLTTAVNGLLTSLTSRLDADGKPVGRTDITSDPADDFRDRLAYRNMLRAARNSAGLDELHDISANRLIRLNFQATVFPDPRNARALAAIQLKVADQGSGVRSRYLLGWLRSVNTQAANRAAGDTTLAELANTGDFELVPFGRGARVLLPVLADAVDPSPDSLRLRARWDEVEATDIERHRSRIATLIRDREAALTSLCAGATSSDLGSELDMGDARIMSHQYMETARSIYQDLALSINAVDIDAKWRRSLEYRETILRHIADRPDCAGVAERYKVRPEPSWKFQGAQVRIYEVGPREQVEQVSTVARSANSLALAASLAASAPSAGIGGSLGAAYRRDVMNRASALERVPEVVGYSLAGEGTFGWVIGPRATTDAKGRAELHQLLKPYDLSVDLSAPSWWSSLDLEVTTLWAPSPHDLADGTLPSGSRADKGGTQSQRSVNVTLPAVPVDYPAFTQLVLRDSVRSLSIDPIVGGPVNACGPTTLLVTGNNIWRAQSVMLMGTTLDRGAIAIAPDMRGIIVTVPAMPAIPGQMAYNKDDELHVLTPLGPKSGRISYVSDPSGDACKPAKVTNATAVTISSISIDDIVVPSLVSIDVKGTNLASVDGVKLASQPGSITQRADDGKSITAEFDEKRTSSISGSRVQLEFFAKNKPVGTPQTIHISRK